MKKLAITLTIIFLNGCASNQSALETHANTARIDSHVVSSYKATDSQLEEYVNRVGKRLQMVSTRPNTNYHFVVTSSDEATLKLDPETKNIEISQGVLHQLKDEAELAAVLGLSMARMNHVMNVDRETATTMSYAGYDPHALLDLQEQYFYAANNKQAHWLNSIYPIPISAGTITANKVMVQNMPKGLLRGAENYQKELNG